MDITLPVTQNATFVCVGQGYGFVDVEWVRLVRNQRERPPPERSTVTTIVTPDNITSTFTIPDVTERENLRNYRCIYNNNAGETPSDTALLTIGGKC